MKATITVLGSGTSMGVPTIGCDCQVCTSSDAHDRRTRPSILIGYNQRFVLIDSTPDFRQQALRENIRRIDAVLYTHGHADHILGLDDLRPLTFKREQKLPLYADEPTANIIERMFAYAFDPESTYSTRPQVALQRLNGTLELFGAKFQPLRVLHGDSEITAFRFGTAAYLTDFSSIPEPTMQVLQNLDVLFLDALRRRPHPTHSSLDESVKIVERLKPRRAFFVHMSHDLAHEETNRHLPSNVRLAYDGMKLEFEI
ncbi:MAG: MBL fold metallo-hydrolase [Acidobacteria bacterium]|nr:MAG: MBL fold metallo-hydrolase [Acidobacteriota bacterium]PYY02950.1 MAG: MBL fold metallo-hydrolase [Acidobacteriota bacterium]PYY21762.1 MAG: MBL fold metallo-hydrolase [Acidobacteriota bacterium]